MSKTIRKLSTSNAQSRAHIHATPMHMHASPSGYAYAQEHRKAQGGLARVGEATVGSPEAKPCTSTAPWRAPGLCLQRPRGAMATSMRAPGPALQPAAAGWNQPTATATWHQGRSLLALGGASHSGSGNLACRSRSPWDLGAQCSGIKNHMCQLDSKQQHE